MSHDWSQLRFIGGGIDACQAYTDGHKVYRAVPKSTTRWKHIPEFLASDEYHQLADEGRIVKATETDIDPATFPSIHPNGKKDRIVYESEFIPFGLYPQKYGEIWTRAQFIEHLRTVARINQVLTKYICNEASFGNFIFNGPQPMLVDLGAIMPKSPATVSDIKAGLTQLLSGSKIGIHTFKFNSPNVWEQIQRHCDHLPNKEPHNQWDEYNARPLPKPQSFEHDQETAWLQGVITRYNIKTVLDIGGNDGYFAFGMAGSGARICSIDRARNAVTKGYLHSKAHNSNVVFYAVDITDPPKDHHRTHTKEVVSWADKLEADCVIVSSVMHHLCHQDKSLAWQIEQYKKLTRKYLLIEYIDKQDPHVRDWPQQWNKENFFSLMEEEWYLTGTLKDYARSEVSRPYRKWYAFERKQPKTFNLGVEEYKEWHSAQYTKESEN